MNVSEEQKGEQKTEVSPFAERFIFYSPAKREEAIAHFLELGDAGVAKALRWLSEPGAGLPPSYLDALDEKTRTAQIAIIRLVAMAALVRMGEAAVAPLIQAVQGPDTTLGAHATRALKRIGEPAVEPLIALLQQGNTNSRIYAASVLSGMDDERAKTALRDAFRQTTKFKNMMRVQMLQGVLLSALVLLLSLSLLNLLYPDNVAGNGAIGILLGCSVWNQTAKMRRGAVAELVKSATPQMVGAFIVCLGDQDGAVLSAAIEALKRLLPQVQASDREYISDAEMTILLKQLDGNNHALNVVILKALQQIGDEKALPKVQYVAQAAAAYPRNVLEAAQECLPFLQQRATKSRQAQTLLRASDADRSPDTLLRAAPAETDTNPAELLRPGL